MPDVQLRCALPAQTACSSTLHCRFGDLAFEALRTDADTIRCTVPEELVAKAESYDVVDGESGALLAKQQLADSMPEDSRPTWRRRWQTLAPFCIMSSSYLLFTITDGAIRMIVLLYAYQKGFTALDVAIMFSAYELAGVFTNFIAGIAGARWGIKSTLLVGLCLQIAGIAMLYAWQDEWSKVQAIVYVTAAQTLCGIAKDLTKLGGKTVGKLVTPDDKQTKLFKLTSFITGFKNSLKGVGFFLGSVLITVSLNLALSVLIGLIVLAIPWALFGLSNRLGRTRKENIRVATIFRKSYNVNMLSLSRLFLFGARDLWFEVPLPFFMREPVYGMGWSRSLVGAVLAIFIIVYGQVQSWTPQLVTKPLRQAPPNKWVAMLWCALLSPVPLFAGLMLLLSSVFDANEPAGPRAAVLMPSIGVYAVLFAVNSSVHSYLIVRYTDGDKVAMNVGFYYMSNAFGRLVGTLASGVLYTYITPVSLGFGVCFLVSVVFTVISALVDVWIRDNEGGLACGPLSCCAGAA